MSFEQVLIRAGLVPRTVVADGRWRRCKTVDKPKKRNGAYVLHPDGRGYWRNWAVDGELNHWREDRPAIVRPIDHARLAAQRDRERADRIRAMRQARDFWAAAKPLLRAHAYIERKGLTPQGCACLRQHNGLLVVPVWHGDWIISVQTIAADGTKRFWPGAPVKAGAYVMDRPRAAVTCLVEGLATGLAVFQAVRTARVIVCFDAGNLLPVAQRLKPKGSVVVCADNDHQTEARTGRNPGLEKARNVAELLGCGVAYPGGILGTDWADALKEWGEHAPRRIEREILMQAKYVLDAEAVP